MGMGSLAPLGFKVLKETQNNKYRMNGHRFSNPWAFALKVKIIIIFKKWTLVPRRPLAFEFFQRKK